MRMLWRSFMLICGLGVVLWPAVPSRATSDPNPGRLTPDRQAVVIHPGLRPGTVSESQVKRIWIHFADRGSRTGVMVPLTERARDRRLRRGVPLNTPERQYVAPEYIEGVRATGARIHRISRWLNAVSVDYQREHTDQLAALPFVARLEPVAVHRNLRLSSEPAAGESYRALRSVAAALNYGSSVAQIQQINVDLAHGRGYSGAGVLVAMFDTGFRKDHEAFSAALGSGRLIAEHDFVFDDGNVQDEAGDQPGAHNHGTSTWSVLGGATDGQLYGPAYGASFLLAKTEDIRSETPVEEDNWLAAVEWADSIGADVISSSLTYSDWYSLSDYDGMTAVITQAANLAATLGIVVCNSAGNSGPDPQTTTAPTDGFYVISVGSVTSSGSISSFSSRGPTFDGRIKPEVCARGSATWRATASGVSSYSSGNGTSFSCPLIGGCAALLLEAHPTWNPLMVREALMQTADRAETPGNTFGWGIADVNAALDYTGSIQIFPLAIGDTLYSPSAQEEICAVLGTLSPVDLTASSLYYRFDSASYMEAPLSALGDTVAGELPAPGTTPAVVDYYFVIRDSVGFTDRAPEPIDSAYTFVWQAVVIGDVNRDLSITSSDIVALVNFVFKSGPTPQPEFLGDVDGIPSITSADIVYLVQYVFKGGPPPVNP